MWIINIYRLGVLRNPKLAKLFVLVVMVILLFGQGKAQKKTVEFKYLDELCSSQGSPAIAYGSIGKETTTCIYNQDHEFSAEKPDACCKVLTKKNDTKTSYGHCRYYASPADFTGYCEACAKEGEKCYTRTSCCAATSNSENILDCPSIGGQARGKCQRTINPKPFPEKCLSKAFCSKTICSNPEFPQADCGPNGECLCPIGAGSKENCRKLSEKESYRVPSAPKNYLVDANLECKTPATTSKRARSYYTLIGLDMSKVKYRNVKNSECVEVCGNKHKYTGRREDSRTRIGYCFCYGGFNNPNGCQKAPTNTKCTAVNFPDPEDYERLICPIPKSSDNVCVIVFKNKERCKANGEDCDNDTGCCGGCCNTKGYKCTSKALCILGIAYGG